MADLNVPDPSQAPEYVSPIALKQTKKEQRFYALMRYRRYALLALIGVIMCAPFLFFASQISGQRRPTPTPTSVVGLASVPTVELRVATSRPTVKPTVYECYSNSDIRFADKFIPVRSKVIVTGFTYANGGLVQVAGAWLDASMVRCGGDLALLEVSYFATVTPFPTNTPVVNAVVPTARIVYVNPSPYPTYTPYPTSVLVSQSQDVNGIWVDGAGCYHFSIYNVREIYVNGLPAAGGNVICDVRDFRVVVK